MNSFLGSLLVAALNLDTTSVIQSSISRPSFIGVLLGFLNGHPFEGFLVGLLIELVILDFPPIGGMPVPNGCIAAGFAAMFIKVGGMYLSFFVGFTIGFLYSYIEKFMREKRSFLNKYLEKLIEKNDFCFGKIILISLLFEFIVSFIYLFLSFSLIYNLYNNMSILNSKYLNEALKLSFISVIFVVFSSLFFKFLTQVRKNA